MSSAKLLVLLIFAFEIFLFVQAGRKLPKLKIYLENVQRDINGSVPFDETLCNLTRLRKNHLMCRTNVRYQGKVEDIYWTYHNDSGEYRVTNNNICGWIEDTRHYRSGSNSYYVAASLCSTSMSAEKGLFKCNYRYKRSYPRVKKGIYIDIDECTLGVDNCNRKMMSCKNNATGSYTCECKDEYLGPHNVCMDGISTECNITDGHYICTCLDGFNNSQTICQVKPCSHEVDECVDETTACNCEYGLELVNGLNNTCEDIDECLLAMDNCENESTKCNNTVGSYSCLCEPQFKPIPGLTNKCDEIACSDCDRVSTVCEPTADGNICKCKMGFEEMDDTTMCYDPALRCSDCDGDSTECAPRGDGFSCECTMGFEQMNDSTTMCRDQDECTLIHRCDNNSTYCNNTAGSYFCSCKPQFKPIPGNTTMCTAITCPDCDEFSTVCQEDNVHGGYKCECRSGHQPILGNTTECEALVTERQKFQDN